MEAKDKMTFTDKLVEAIRQMIKWNEEGISVRIIITPPLHGNGFVYICHSSPPRSQGEKTHNETLFKFSHDLLERKKRREITALEKVVNLFT